MRSYEACERGHPVSPQAIILSPFQPLQSAPSIQRENSLPPSLEGKVQATFWY